MQSTYSFCTSIKLEISWKSRLKASGKVLFATWVSVSQVWSILPLLRTMYLMNTMVDPVALLGHALVFGLTAGYVLRVTMDIVRGYARTRWFDTLVVNGPPLIAERSGKHYTVTESHDSQTNSSDEHIVSARKREPSRQAFSKEELIECVLIDGQNDIPVYGPAVAAKKTIIKRTVRLLISLFDRFRIWLLGPDGKCLELLFNQRRSSLIAFLASVGRGTVARWKGIDDLFYRGLLKASMYQDKSDMQEYVHKTASSAYPDSTPPDLLKKRAGKAGYTALALSPDCLVDEPAHLIFWHQRVQAYWEDQKNFPPIKLEELREGEDYVPSAHGSGFVGQNLEEDLHLPPGDRVWTWAVEPYQKHRTHHLDFLRHAAERELEASRKAVDPAERQERLKRTRDCYSALVVAGSRLYPDVRRCKAALHHIRVISEQLNDTTSAEKIERVYEQNLDHWEQLQKQDEYASGE